MRKRFAYHRNMIAEPSTAIAAALIGVPARANILGALMDGRALTASELAYHAGVSPQTTSSHLAKLADAKLIAVEKQGRHRYYRLAGAAVAEALELLALIVPQRPVPPRRRSREVEETRAARFCYDHLAGALGTGLTEAMQARGLLRPAERDFEVTAAGEAFFRTLGLEPEALRGLRRAFARQCLDWSERRPHLAGSLGAGFARVALERRWIRRAREGRRVFVAPAGQAAFRDLLDFDFAARAAGPSAGPEDRVRRADVGLVEGDVEQQQADGGGQAGQELKRAPGELRLQPLEGRARHPVAPQRPAVAGDADQAQDRPVAKQHRNGPGPQEESLPKGGVALIQVKDEHGRPAFTLRGLCPIPIIPSNGTGVQGYGGCPGVRRHEPGGLP